MRTLPATATLLATERGMLLKVEVWAAETDDRELRRRLCRLMNRLAQDIARMRDALELEIESRR